MASYDVIGFIGVGVFLLGLIAIGVSMWRVRWMDLLVAVAIMLASLPFFGAAAVMQQSHWREACQERGGHWLSRDRTCISSKHIIGATK